MYIPKCERCGGEHVKLRRLVIGNGDCLVAWRCLDCNRWASNPVQWLAHEAANAMLAKWGKKVQSLDKVDDYSAKGTPCLVCGDHDTEWHHVAPEALAEQFGGEWICWPVIPLCRKHHILWHQIVTPGLSTGGAPTEQELALGLYAKS
jgi:hypothetical protein